MLQMPWASQERVVQTVHASNNYHGGPWFDSVVCSAADPEQDNMWHGLLLSLFWSELGGVPMPLAFIRWYRPRRCATPDVLVRHGCVPLEWETMDITQPRLPRQRGKAPTTSVPSVSVVALSSLLRRAYIVPDFTRKATEPPRFHSSIFKWNRHIPDHRQLLLLEAELEEGDPTSGHDTGEEEEDNSVLSPSPFKP
jgi:hypothetical protein